MHRTSSKKYSATTTNNKVSNCCNLNIKNIANNNYDESSTYHYHREPKKNPHLTDVDRNWEKMQKFRERKMAMMRTHKLNVESRLKKEPIFLQPVHSKVLRAEGRKTCLEPDWYTENIYSNQSIDNSDDDKKRVFTILNSSNDEESDDLFILAATSPSKRRRGGYPKSNSCCFGATTTTDKPRRSNISKSHSFSTPRGTKYDFVEMAEYNNGQPLYRICDREGCMSETCFTRDLKTTDQYVMNEWDVRNKNYEHNELFNDADIFSYDDDEYPQQQQQQPARNSTSLEQLFRSERSKMLLRNKFEKLNKYTDDFLDDYNRSFDDILRVTEYSSPNYYHPSGKNFVLDIKPSKYDDSASDCTDTDVELDDFYFDFEKYWSELKKKTDDSINRNTSSYKKIKDVNKERLTNLDTLNGNDCYESDEIEVVEEEEDDDEEPFASPYHHRRRQTNAFSLLNNIFSIYKPNKYSPLNCHQTNAENQQQQFKNKNRLKSFKSNKLNLLSSTVRPLGGVLPPSNMMCKSSTMRPLMIAPHDAMMRHSSSYHDLPRFQIIPQKTGLKISPLYHYDHNTGTYICPPRRLGPRHTKPRYKLKSTTRPLTFW